MNIKLIEIDKITVSKGTIDFISKNFIQFPIAGFQPMINGEEENDLMKLVHYFYENKRTTVKIDYENSTIEFMELE